MPRRQNKSYALAVDAALRAAAAVLQAENRGNQCYIIAASCSETISCHALRKHAQPSLKVVGICSGSIVQPEQMQ